MAQVEVLDALVQAQMIQNYTAVATLALLVYEVIVNLPEECEFIWKARGSTGMKVIYAICRYSPCIDVPMGLIFVIPGASITTCKTFYSVLAWVSAIGMLGSELIVVVRTWAIYGRSRSALACLFILFFALALTCLVSWGFWTRSWEWGPTLVVGVTGCRITHQTRIMFIPFVGLCVVEIVIVAMTLHEGLKDFSFRDRRRSPIITRLYVDGILFFVALLLISLTTIILLTRPFYWASFFVKIARICHSVLGCRILLNLRIAAAVPNLNLTEAIHIDRHWQHTKSGGDNNIEFQLVVPWQSTNENSEVEEDEMCERERRNISMSMASMTPTEAAHGLAHELVSGGRAVDIRGRGGDPVV